MNNLKNDLEMFKSLSFDYIDAEIDPVVNCCFYAGMIAMQNRMKTFACNEAEGMQTEWQQLLKEIEEIKKLAYQEAEKADEISTIS